MEKTSFVVDDRDCGVRLDRYLASRLPKGVSRSYVQRLIKEGAALVGGAPAKAHHMVAEGEVVEVTMPDPRAVTIGPEDLPLDIVYEDADVVVVNKPAGMVVHPAPGNPSGTLLNALLHRSTSLSGIGGALRPGVVHRIDKGTSGLLVVAKNDAAHRGLAGQFKDRTTDRIYVAIVKGVVQFDRGTIELPIGRSSRDRKKMAVVSLKPKAAVTRYRVLRRFEDSTFLELKLETGRTHQIRVHLAYIGYPILGDDTYGAKGLFGRPALHAKTLGFIHPGTGKRMEFDSEMPSDMQEYIRSRGG